MERQRKDPHSDAEIIRAAFDSIDYEKLHAQAHLSPAEKMRLMFDLIDQEQQSLFAEEKTHHPDESDELVWRRVRDRILDRQDLSDKVRADVKEWIRRKENEPTSV